jgi:hypothetical protein
VLSSRKQQLAPQARLSRNGPYAINARSILMPTDRPQNACPRCSLAQLIVDPSLALQCSFLQPGKSVCAKPRLASGGEIGLLEMVDAGLTICKPLARACARLIARCSRRKRCHFAGRIVPQCNARQLHGTCAHNECGWMYCGKAASRWSAGH